MKAVRNTTPKPVRVPLHGGHVLHLGPFKTGQVSDHDAERPSLRRLVERGDIAFLDDAGDEETPSTPSAGRVSESGRPQRKAAFLAGGRTAGGRRER